MKNKAKTMRATLAATILAAVSFAGSISEIEAADPVEIGHVLGLRSREMTKDYRIAMELMMERVFEEFGVSTSMNAFETAEEALEAFWSGEVDVTEISSLDLVLLPKEKRDRMRIVGVVNLDEDHFKKYQLVAAPGTKLEDLEGEPVHVVGRGEWNVGRRWLELELIEKFGKSSDEFFGKITVVDYEQPNEVVLPTFFGKSKACLVMSHQIDLLAELNPQLSVRLKPILSSPEMMGLSFVIRADYGDAKIKELQESTAKLHTTPDGQQAFTLMKVSRMSGASEADLLSLEAIAKRMKENEKAEFIAALPKGIGAEED